MKKNELVELLKSLGIPINEGVTSLQYTDVYPRVVFWDYIWEDQIASSKTANEIDTYQISFYAKEPRHQKLLELRDCLRNNNIFVTIYHEYVKEEKVFHSYFSLEVMNNEFSLE